jgi:hypothetical protein
MQPQINGISPPSSTAEPANSGRFSPPAGLASSRPGAVDPLPPQAPTQETTAMSQTVPSSNGIVPSQTARIEVIGV